MTTLTAAALATLHDAGVNSTEWCRAQFGDDHWRGDACGCPHDRCAGFHHDDEDDDNCGCLVVLLDELYTTRHANETAAPIWASYQQALAAGNHPGADVARTAAQEWVELYYPAALTSSLDQLVDGQAGITITGRYNDRHWLVWNPEQPRVIVDAQLPFMTDPPAARATRRKSHPRPGPTLTASQRQLAAEILCLSLILGIAVVAIVTILRPIALIVLVLVPMIAIVLSWLLLNWALGYRPVTSAEREQILSRPCWHVTRSDLTAARLMDPGQSRSRMFFATAAWRPPARAVFMFTRPPDRIDFWSNIGWRDTTGLTTRQIQISTDPGPLYIRRDGAVASTQPISMSRRSEPPPV